MKTSLVIFYLFTSILVLAISCQKEYSLEENNVSEGSLKNPLTGDCFPANSNGIYLAGQNLNDSDYIKVQVNVTKTGYYSIQTDTVNGYYFKSTGSFSTTGINMVLLKGSGKPIAPGNNVFSIIYDTSACKIVLTVLPSINNTPAIYTLRGSPNACMIDTVFGYFIKNVGLTASSYVKVGVDVSSAGTYNISTNTVNGYSFTGSGIFTTNGAQFVILTGTGTPLNVETDQFTVSGVSSSCTFHDTVLNAVGVTNNDHFPLTFGSYWNYDNLLSPGDTLKRNITDSISVGGKGYKILEEKPMVATAEQYIFRKEGDNYYEYGSVDKYTTSVKFNPQINNDILFLKENLNTGDQWTSDEYIGTITGGQSIYLQYDFSCIDANAVVTINGKTFINVYKIDMKPTLRSAVTYPYVGTGELRHLYYAKGVGLIYAKSISLGFSLQEFQIRNWQVN